MGTRSDAMDRGRPGFLDHRWGGCTRCGKIGRYDMPLSKRSTPCCGTQPRTERWKGWPDTPFGRNPWRSPLTRRSFN